MSLLYSVVFRSVCRGTHHRLAIDALRHLRGVDAERWTDVFLHYHAAYLRGSKAPDDQFKDFRNHVLHVAENYWGGAPAEARRWYGRVVDAFRRRAWSEAVFAAGVLSHYFSDPFMPLHTAQTEEETKIHRALEWSVAKSYGTLQQIIELDQGGYPALEATRHDDWLERMIRTGAELAHGHYQAILAHYDLSRGVRQPEAGMDQECQNRIAECLAHAVIGLARVLERAIDEAEAEPPAVENTLLGFFAVATTPVRAIVHHLQDLNDRMIVEAIHDEVQRTGKVVKNLPADDREIRHLHAEEVLRVTLHELDQRPAKVTGTMYGSGPAARHHRNSLITTPQVAASLNVSMAWKEAAARSQDSGARNQESEGSGQAAGVRSQARAAWSRDTAPRATETFRKAGSYSGRGFGSSPREEVRSLVPVGGPLAAMDDHAGTSARTSVITLPMEPRSDRKPPADPPAPAKSPRFYLRSSDPVVDAPTIGPKLAGRLEQVGVVTVGDLLNASPDELAAKMKQKQITADTVRQWQQEATLVCSIPELRGHDAQLLVAAGITEPDQLGEQTANQLLEALQPIVQGKAGKQILRNQKPPDAAEVSGWIERAKAAA